MRCKNCGWENPSGISKCEKCHASLSGSMAEHNSINNNQRNYSQHEESLRATVREQSFFGHHNTSNIQSCQNCGYELSEGTRVCPACGTPINGKTQLINENGWSNVRKCPNCGIPLQQGIRFCPQCGTSMDKMNKGTVRAWDNPQQGQFCSLRPLAWAREEINYNPISYSGQTIVLNRANTDPNNQTITSQEQAILYNEGGVWYIENRSSSESTMLRVRKKTRLESGDIIALGNRLFEFKD